MITLFNKDIASFWGDNHPVSLLDCGYNPMQPSNYVFAELDANQLNIESVAIFVPFIKDGIKLGHHVHLCSINHSKKLFNFCFNALYALNDKHDVGLICCETQGTNLRAERVAYGLGFRKIKVPNTDWFEYLWDSKNPPIRE